jgi:hypothetical protein
MTDIILTDGSVEFQSSVCGLVQSEITECEVVEETSFHLGTNVGTFLINVQQFTINSITFETANEAVTYISNN